MPDFADFRFENVVLYGIYAYMLMEFDNNLKNIKDIIHILLAFLKFLESIYDYIYIYDPGKRQALLNVVPG